MLLPREGSGAYHAAPGIRQAGKRPSHAAAALAGRSDSSRRVARMWLTAGAPTTTIRAARISVLGAAAPRAHLPGLGVAPPPESSCAPSGIGSNSRRGGKPMRPDVAPRCRHAIKCARARRRAAVASGSHVALLCGEHIVTDVSRHDRSRLPQRAVLAALVRADPRILGCSVSMSSPHSCRTSPGHARRFACCGRRAGDATRRPRRRLTRGSAVRRAKPRLGQHDSRSWCPRLSPVLACDQASYGREPCSRRAAWTSRSASRRRRPT
jgi:hypothetical protein